MDDLRLKPVWKESKDLSPLTGKVVRIRYRLHNARLYAFRIQKNGTKQDPQAKGQADRSAKALGNIVARIEDKAQLPSAVDQLKGTQKRRRWCKGVHTYDW
jgi:hypothetical protein